MPLARPAPVVGPRALPRSKCNAELHLMRLEPKLLQAAGAGGGLAWGQRRCQWPAPARQRHSLAARLPKPRPAALHLAAALAAGWLAGCYACCPAGRTLKKSRLLRYEGAPPCTWSLISSPGGTGGGGSRRGARRGSSKQTAASGLHCRQLAWPCRSAAAAQPAAPPSMAQVEATPPAWGSASHTSTSKRSGKRDRLQAQAVPGVRQRGRAGEHKCMGRRGGKMRAVGGQRAERQWWQQWWGASHLSPRTASIVAAQQKLCNRQAKRRRAGGGTAAGRTGHAATDYADALLGRRRRLLPAGPGAHDACNGAARSGSGWGAKLVLELRWRPVAGLASVPRRFSGPIQRSGAVNRWPGVAPGCAWGVAAAAAAGASRGAGWPRPLQERPPSYDRLP